MSTSASRPRLALTLGDPRGIGPELVAKTLGADGVGALADFVVVGPSGTGLDVQVDVGAWRADGGPAEAGRLAGLAIEAAVGLARDGVVQGIVTAPLD